MNRLIAIAVFLIAFGQGLPAAEAQNALRAVAVVNDEIISMLDLEMRTRLAILSTGQQDSPRLRQRIQPQVLRALIDERLQAQEAARLDIKVQDADIDEALARLARQNNMPLADFMNLLTQRGISPETLRSQVKAQLLWRTLVARRLRPSVSVASEEVDEIAGRIAASRGTVQRRLAEIFLAVDNPAQEDDVRRNAERLIEQLRAGAKFPALARQFSQSATAARGGDLGWIQEGQLAPEIDRALAQMKPGQISVPIRSLSGFHIVWLRDERKLSAGDVLLNLKQVLFALPADASTDLQRQVESKARSAKSEIDGCEGVDDLAAEIGSPGSGDLGTVKLGDLPSDLQSTVQGLALGEPSAPVPVSGGLAVLLVCKRTDSGIDRERIREQLVGQRVDNLARRFMRDLRRSANVDIRI